MRADLLVVGAGPAGASAAITAARQGMRVVLCERQIMRDGTARDKVCGEFISPEALPLLRALAPEALAKAPEISSAAFIARGGRRGEFTLPAPGRGCSRLQLDAALWRAAVATGVDCRPATPIAEHAIPSEFAGAAIIRATGRADAGPWVGIKARFAGLPPSTSVELFSIPGGYCGIAPVEAGLTNVCCLLRRRHAGALTGARDFAAWLHAHARSQPLRRRLDGARPITATVFTLCGLGRQSAPRGGAFAAGDAAGFLDPFTGDGIARALLSGQLAGEAAAAGRLADYPRSLAQSASRGFRAATLLRWAMHAPAAAQSLLAPLAAQPLLARRLLAATRWRGLQ
ncbi:MAG TPA: FAD-dependent oxidoreductase [Terriglobales bacterium]|nr:FAD-dependent oxidoreductase [Terriglobales bacterium]